MNLVPERGVAREVKGCQTPSSKLYCSTPPSTVVPLKPPMAKIRLPKVTAEKSDLISFMSGSGSHWLVPVLQVVKFLKVIHVKLEQQIRTWVVDLSRSQPSIGIAIITSKSHQPLGSIQRSSILVWPISRLCNTWTGS